MGDKIQSILSSIEQITGRNVWPYAVIVGLVIVSALVALELTGGMRLLSFKKRRMRYKNGHASALLYRRLVRPGVVKLSNGAFLGCFEMAAPDASVYDNEMLIQAEVGLARAVGQFSERMVVHMHQRHGPYSEYDVRESEYPHPVLEWLDMRRQAFFMSGRTFRSKRIVSVAWMPASEATEKARSLASVGVDSAVRSEDEIIAEFEEQLERVESFFRQYGSVRRLGEVREPDKMGILRNRNELLEHLAWCISGREQKVIVPPPGQAINGLLAESFVGGFDVRVGDMETRIVVLKDIPEQTFPLVFARLSELKLDYTLAVRWMPLSGSEARQILKGAYAEWTMKSNESMTMQDPHSVDMMESSRQALGFLSAGGKFGLVSPYVILRGKDKAKVEQAATKTIALLDEIGYKAFRATFTAEDDYFASLPGDGYHGVRKYPLNALNLAHLFSFHEESSGRRYIESPTLANKRSPALAYAISGAGETLYHVHVNDEPRDLFHHFGVGGTGSGKSVTLANVAAHWVGRLPYAGFTGIDRGRSLYRLTRFLDGNFYDLLGDNSPGFAIFADVDNDPEMRRDLLGIIEGMIEIQGVGVTPSRRRALELATDAILALPSHLRSLKAFYELLQDPEAVLRPALRLYTRDGVLGGTLDCEVDSFDTGLFNVIEIGRVWQMDPKYLVPVIKVMFWKARTQVKRLKHLTGNMDYHWLFELDEAHTLLKHPLGEQFIQDMLKMGRKEKMYVGLWTNAAADFARSSILNDITEACKTRFFFRNTEVMDDDKVRSYYSALGLTRHGIEMLPDVQQHALLMYQSASRELQEIKWGFDKAWLAVIGRSRDSDNRRLDEFMARFPDTWREELLRYEGVDDRQIAQLVSLMAEAKRRRDDLSLSVQAAS